MQFERKTQKSIIGILHFKIQIRRNRNNCWQSTTNLDRNFKQISNWRHCHKKNKPFGFFVLESNGEVNIKHATTKNTKKASSKILKKDTIQRFFKQIWFRLCFCLWDTINQVGKIAPALIKNAGWGINNIAQQKINQIITQGG